MHTSPALIILKSALLIYAYTYDSCVYNLGYSSLTRGAGCAGCSYGQTETPAATKPAVAQEAADLNNNIAADDAASVIPITKKSDTGLTVTAESTDVGTLVVNLDVAENLTKEVDVYRLMLSM